MAFTASAQIESKKAKQHKLLWWRWQQRQQRADEYAFSNFALAFSPFLRHFIWTIVLNN